MPRNYLVPGLDSSNVHINNDNTETGNAIADLGQSGTPLCAPGLFVKLIVMLMPMAERVNKG